MTPIQVEFNVAVRMRDGTQLAADIYRPRYGRRFPVLLLRTPYLKSKEDLVARACYFAERGYAFVIQDVRGRGDSDGKFYPFVHEAQDGYDSITWAGKQLWSNGKVGMIGSSYSAWAQWLCAPLGNRHLRAMLVEACPPDFFENLPYQHGVLCLAMYPWLVYVDGRMNQPIEGINWNELLRKRPLKTLDALCGRRLRAWQDWLKHDRYDAYWHRISFARWMEQIRVPVFHITGWYDDVLIGSLTNFKRMKGRGRKQSPPRQKLLIGPWPHKVNTTTRFGPIDFGPEGLIDLNQAEMRWFDFWLKGEQNGIASGPPVRLFVLGENKWRDEDDWPLPDAHEVEYYFHSKGGANTTAGDGRLDQTPPGDEPPDEYTYDPADPVPFIMDPGFAQVGGPDNYREVEARPDVLVYTTAPLREEVEVTGPVKVRLYAASSARDTDFTAKLLDVFPDGYAMRLNDGIVRGRFRESIRKPTPLIPGRIYEYWIDCWAISNLFRKGHRIRVEISSSAFPKFEPNLNTGRPIAFDKKGVRARQTIFHDKDHPSCIILPLVERARAR